MLEQRRVAVLGLGLIGGSLALALREKVRALYAMDPDPDTRVLARSWKLADMVTASPEEAVAQADLVILAAPVRSIIELVYQLPRWMPQPAVILDVGSTKRHVMEAMGTLPPRLSPVGGHPLAGREISGLLHATPDLFQGAPFLLTELPNTTATARQVAEALVRTLGATPIWVDAVTHDRTLGLTSHLPYVLSVALTQLLAEEHIPYAGPGLRSMIRLAGSSPQMMLDILRTNRDMLIEALEQLQDHLSVILHLLAEDKEDELRTIIENAVAWYRKLY